MVESQRQRKTQPMWQRLKRSAHGAKQFRTVCETAFRPDSGEQKIHDARRMCTHEYSQQAETREKYAAQRRRALRKDCTVSGAVKASGRPWSTRHEPRKARVNDLWSRTLRWGARTRRPQEDPRTRSCEGCDVAGSNGEHQGPSQAQKNKVIEKHSIKRSA